jgi:hypothetical protein
MIPVAGDALANRKQAGSLFYIGLGGPAMAKGQPYVWHYPIFVDRSEAFTKHISGRRLPPATPELL